MRKLNDAAVVEFLFDPINHLFAVRPIPPEDKHAVYWATVYPTWCRLRKVNGSAFLPVMYQILGWKPENKYRIRGIRRQRGTETILMFDLHETEVLIPIVRDGASGNAAKQPFPIFDADTTPITSRGKRSVVAYPADWVESFGADAYQHEQSREIAAIDRDGMWGVTQTGKAYQTEEELQVSSPEAIAQGINHILTTITQQEVINE